MPTKIGSVDDRRNSVRLDSTLTPNGGMSSPLGQPAQSDQNKQLIPICFCWKT